LAKVSLEKLPEYFIRVIGTNTLTLIGVSQLVIF